MTESEYYEKLTEVRTGTEVIYKDLGDKGKTALKNLPRNQGIYSFFHLHSNSLNRPLIFILIGGFGSLFILGFAGNALRFTEILIILSIFQMFFSGCLVHAGYLVLKSFFAPLSSRIYVTPLYIIEVDGTQFRYWGIWALMDFVLTDVYVNGIYKTTTVDILVPDNELKVNIRGENAVNEFMNVVNQWKETSLQAKSENHWDYYIQHDILKEVNEKSINTTLGNDGKTKKSSDLIKWVGYAIASILLTFSVISISKILAEESKEKQLNNSTNQRKR